MRRFLIRYRLKTFLFAVAVTGISLGWVTHHWAEFNREQQILATAFDGELAANLNLVDSTGVDVWATTQPMVVR